MENKYYRKVIFTTKQQQLVLMNLLPKEEIGMEKHNHTTQFIRVEKGSGIAIVGKKRFRLQDGSAVVIPAGKNHNILAGKKGLKLYTIYSPPEYSRDLKEWDKYD